MDVADYYNNGMSWDEFVESSKENQDRMRAFYDEFDLDEDNLAFFNSRTPLQVLAIAEDWCPDVVQNLGLLARIADDVPGMELSIVRRDENPELMDAYLTNDKRRIPVFVFFDMTMRELARWTGRCKPADDWIFNEVVKDKAFKEMGDADLNAFNEEYDRRFRDDYAWVSLKEWELLLTEEDF